VGALSVLDRTLVDIFAGFLVATEFVAMGTGALGTTFDISALVTAAEIVLQTLVHILTRFIIYVKEVIRQTGAVSRSLAVDTRLGASVVIQMAFVNILTDSSSIRQDPSIRTAAIS